MLIIPYPAQGHMIPILDLAHLLAATGRLTLTILSTPKNAHLLAPLISTYPSKVNPLVFPFPETPSLPAGKENTKDLPPSSFRPVMFALSLLKHPLRIWFDSHPSPPVGIVSDIFLGWTHRFAAELGIKRVVFSPSGAMALSVIYSLWRDMPREEECRDGEFCFRDVPNSPKYPWWQLSPVFRSYVEGDEVSELIKDGFAADMDSWALVINSFSELERVYLDHLMATLGHRRVWAVGPLLIPEGMVGAGGLEGRGGESSVEVGVIFSWLDTCLDDEVVYVSFGTQAVLTGEEMEALAEGLEKSGVRFIWTVKDPDPSMEGADWRVPPGFEERVVGRGMVIRGWAPQVPILSHRAVGVFLTHCGWNSALEGFMAGVELLAWPMGADQFTNATLLVDQLQVGVRVCEGSTTVPKPDYLAWILAESVSRDGRNRERIRKLSNSALEAVSVDGSSSKELVSLVDALTDLVVHK